MIRYLSKAHYYTVFISFMVDYGGAGVLVVGGSFDSGPNVVFVNYKPPVKRIRMEELKFDEMKGFMIKDYNLQLKNKNQTRFIFKICM